jgi:hypothetical protein
MKVDCTKIDVLKPPIMIMQWKIECSEEDYDSFIRKLRGLRRNMDTLVLVTPEKTDPLKCFTAYIHALDAFKISRSKAKTLDLEALIIIYGDTQIGRLLSRIKNKIQEKGSYNVCILYRGEHPDPRYLPEPPEEPQRCRAPKLEDESLNKLGSIVANYLSII